MFFSTDGIKIPQLEGYSLKEEGKSFIISIPDGELIYYPSFLNKIATTEAMASFLTSENLDFPNPLKCLHSIDQLEQASWKNIPWKRDKVIVFGKEHLTPRFTSWHGDKEATYSYSNTEPLIPNPWTPTLLNLKKEIEAVANTKFNSVLLNWYRNGEDHMGWHADDEKELGENPIIASLNFGAPRRFVLKRNSNNTEKVDILLNNGDLLIMAGSTQHHWLHSVPKQMRITLNRFNLTFRQIKS